MSRFLLALRGMLLGIALVGCSTANPSASTPASEPATLPASISPSGSGTPALGAETPASTTSPSLAPGAVLVPGTHVAIVPPDGFVAAEAYPGFENTTSRAAILVTEMPGAYREVADGVTDEGLAAKGVTVTGRAAVTIDGRESLMIDGTGRNAEGERVGEILLYTGTDRLIAMVAGAFLEGDSATAEVLRAALLTVSLDPDRPTDPQAALRFTVTPEPPLRFAGVIGNSALYNTSGAIPSADINEPFLAVAPSPGWAADMDLATLARTRIQQTATIRDVSVESSSDVTIAGLSGIVLIATAARATREGTVVVYQVLLDDVDGYVLMTGICPVERRAECLNAFEKTAETYRPKD